MPCASPIEVTVFPSPWVVGVIAVTMISFPRSSNRSSASRSSFTFATYSPYGTRYSLGTPSVSATCRIGCMEFS
jgi:hypothetical protein